VLGQYNDLLSKKLVLGLNEVKGSDGGKWASNLKNLATQKDTLINGKYEKQRRETYYARIFGFSNDSLPFHIEEGDRRFFPMSTSAAKKGDTEFWETYHHLLQDDDYIRRIFRFLEARHITGWNPNTVAMTETKRAMISCVKKGPKHFMYHFDWEHHLNRTKKARVVEKKGVSYHVISCADLHDLYEMWDCDNKRVFGRRQIGLLKAELMVGGEGVVETKRWEKKNYYFIDVLRQKEFLKQQIAHVEEVQAEDLTFTGSDSDVTSGGDLTVVGGVSSDTDGDDNTLNDLNTSSDDSTPSDNE
jgi:hypothetical protein